MNLTEPEQEMEWFRRKNLPHVQTRRFFSKRSNTYELTLCGKELGSKTEVLKRGKVIQTLFFLPDFKE